ncbi:MAG: CoA transferase, partial [Bacillota bacterium]
MPRWGRRHKKDIAMDLKNPEVKEMIKELVKQSDVVIQNFAPGTMERLGKNESNRLHLVYIGNGVWAPGPSFEISTFYAIGTIDAIIAVVLSPFE